MSSSELIWLALMVCALILLIVALLSWDRPIVYLTPAAALQLRAS